MPGQAEAPKAGKALRDEVAQLGRQLGLKVQTEVRAGRRLWGRIRYIDIVLTSEKDGKRLGIECKYQSTLGTAEEKIPAVLLDIVHWPIPGIVVIKGEGFSANMQGYLLSTGKVVFFEDLEEWLRLYFGL